MVFRQKFLHPADISKCKQLTGSNDLNGKRALALLALNKGASLNEAASQSGLTRGQVRYILFRFHEMGINAIIGGPSPVLGVDPLPGIKPASKDDSEITKKKKKTEKKKKEKKRDRVKDKEKGKSKKGKLKKKDKKKKKLKNKNSVKKKEDKAKKKLKKKKKKK